MKVEINQLYCIVAPDRYAVGGQHDRRHVSARTRSNAQVDHQAATGDGRLSDVGSRIRRCTQEAGTTGKIDSTFLTYF